MQLRRIIYPLIICLLLAGNVSAQDGNPWVPTGSSINDGTWVPLSEYDRENDGIWVPSSEYNPENDGIWVEVEPTTPPFWDDFFQRWKGSSMITAGTQLVRWGLTGTGVLVADDATGVGVVDDPLIVATGGVVVIGGVILIGGGVYLWIETVFDD